jgi:AraC-like DNA-binding protein
MTTTERVIAYLQSCEMRRAKLNIIAPALAMSTTTLRRRLREEGSRFSQLMAQERIRRIQAVGEIKPKARGDYLAVECGYATRAQFYRAFQSIVGQRWIDYHRQAQ